jgi:nucleotide-binding universal stress UspA family protein
VTLKNLLVFVDDQPRCAPRLELAAQLARRHDAHLTGIHVYRPLSIPPALDGVVVDEILLAEDEISQQVAAAAEALFSEAMRREGLRHDWRVERSAAPGRAAFHARAADLAILGQVSSGAESLVMPEEVAFLSGRPVLVVPGAGRFARVAENPIVAWKPGREAARAVHDALPLLAAAGKATILVVDPDEESEGETPGDELALHLSRHGVKATVDRAYTEGGTPVADVILSRAADLGADLLVMGCYGHARLREMILGGVTRDILGAMTLPVLMSH